jgi:hypothetical protein
MRMMHLTLAAGLVVLSACGAKSNAATQPPSTPAPVVTTAAAPATTTAASTTTTTTVAPTTTTVAVTTTTEPNVAALEAEVRQALIDRDHEREVCLRTPVTCDPSTYARGRYLTLDTDFRDALIGREAFIDGNPDDPSYFVVSSITFDATHTKATLTGCSWDTGLILGAGRSIFNDRKVSEPLTIELIREGNQWYQSGVYREGDEIVGRNTCGARQ